jgi:DNA polymerase-3 subunit gamma/tau
LQPGRIRMADLSASSDLSEAPPPKPREYVVVARRYRPQTFAELVGQDHVAKALASAITTHRVGHAYLFAGARGVGKTSAARILAKALNCVEGPAPVPCNRCDICQSVSSGDDIDVLEIDGASNRGIDEIRQLRQNVSVRPSRARFKIYIIDEVHMLTREAFNALLKTLEEPPEHVKFIFCTTEPTKIPITILSRCQRFDFAGILAASIVQRLGQIVRSEKVEADPEALDVIARRAAGSMRDAESLLEQLLAFGSGRITAADVHAMLGSAGEERLAELVGHLVDRDPAAALRDLDRAVQQGVDVSLLLEQLFGYFRDCMLAVVGCPPEAFLYASPSGKEAVVGAGERLGLQTLLAVMQILDQALGRLRFSTQGRVLAELALVRIATLEELDELPKLIAQLREPLPAGETGPGNSSAASRETARPEQRRRSEAGDSPRSVEETDVRPPGPKLVLSRQNAAEIWSKALSKVSGLAASNARDYADLAVPSPHRLVVGFKPAYTLAKSICERPDQAARFEQALADLTGQPIRVEFVLLEGESDQDEPGSRPRALSPQQRMMEISQHPMIRRAAELFGANPTDVIDPPPED